MNANEFELRVLVGRRIKEARERLELTQTELAHAINKTTSTISSYENGTHSIKLPDLPLLANVLKVPVSYFFNEVFFDQETSEMLKQLHPSFYPLIGSLVKEQIKLLLVAQSNLRLTGADLDSPDMIPIPQ